MYTVAIAFKTEDFKTVVINAANNYVSANSTLLQLHRNDPPLIASTNHVSRACIISSRCNYRVKISGNMHFLCDLQSHSYTRVKDLDEMFPLFPCHRCDVL